MGKENPKKTYNVTTLYGINRAFSQSALFKLIKVACWLSSSVALNKRYGRGNQMATARRSPLRRANQTMNKVILIGFATRDAELTETSSGVKICRFTIAVNRNYTGADGERKTDFFPVVCWRGLAESVARYVHKGSRVCVCGSLESRTYEDSDGKKAVIEVIAQDVEFLTSRTANSDNNKQSGGGQNKGKKPQLQPFDDDSDIPF